jgi:glycine/D-amino acid oxidase-like deaminating enzyme
MLWRDDESLASVSAALTAGGIGHQRIMADDVGSVYPGLRPDGRDAVFTEAAGVVHADRLLQGSLAAFIAAGGQYRPDSRVVSVSPGVDAVEVTLFDGAVVSSDQVLVSAGPGTRELLDSLGLQVPLRPYIEEVVYLGDPTRKEPAPDLPGLVDCPIRDEPGVYAMPNQKHGFKIGLDKPLRSLAGATLGDDLDRVEVPDRTEQIRSRVERDITSVPPQVLATQVCTWTDSGDGDFVIGRVHPRAVVACGDSGEGFKFSAFMGEYLADLVSGGQGDNEFQEHWDPFRFDTSDPRDQITAIGRH